MRSNAFAILLLVILCCLYPIYYVEYTKYESLHVECNNEWRRNERILDSAMCADAQERIFLGKKIQSVCIEAEQENRVTPRQCALRQWWHQFWVYTFFHQMTDSYWKVMPVVTISIVVMLWLASQHWIERTRIKELGRMFGQVQQQTQEFSRPYTKMIEQQQPRIRTRKRYKPIIEEWQEDDYVPMVGAVDYE